MDLSSHGVVAVIVREGKILMLEDAREQTLGWWGPVHGRCELEDEMEENSVIRELWKK